MTLLFFCWLVALAAAVSFDAKPDHRDKVTREIVVGKHRYLCEFEFACAGGSLEAWDIDVLATSSYADGKQSTEVELLDEKAVRFELREVQRIFELNL